MPMLNQQVTIRILADYGDQSTIDREPGQVLRNVPCDTSRRSVNFAGVRVAREKFARWRTVDVDVRTTDRDSIEAIVISLRGRLFHVDTIWCDSLAYQTWVRALLAPGVDMSHILATIAPYP